MSKKDKLFAMARKFHQEHIFRWWDELSAQCRRALLRQVEQIDFEHVAHLIRQITQQRPAEPQEDIDPLPAEVRVNLPRTTVERRRAVKAQKIGQDALSAGKAAALLVAGGQATRLRFENPKGFYAIGPISGKSLFQIHAEKVLALSRRFRVRIPLYIMTSDATDMATRAYFEAHRWFGLRPDDVFFMKQDSLPAIDEQGKIMLDAKYRIVMSPNGHGGCIPAMKKSGALEDMRSRGIETVFFFHVDNPLVKVLDPVFLGYHLAAGAEMSGKFVPKRAPEEKVGVAAMVGNKVTVIEYINLSRQAMYERNPDGTLKYSAGVIGVYILNVSFIERLISSGITLPIHRSHKSVPYLDMQGRICIPDKPNAYKFESFIFDALPHSQRCIMMEVARDEEFAPIKKFEGEDSPTSAVTMMCDLFGRWLRRAGVRVKSYEPGCVAVPIEISPLFALDEAELRRRIRGKKIHGNKPIYLEAFPKDAHLDKPKHRL